MTDNSINTTPALKNFLNRSKPINMAAMFIAGGTSQIFSRFCKVDDSSGYTEPYSTLTNGNHGVAHNGKRCFDSLIMALERVFS